MGWFSPVKGSYPSLAQIDKTLPVASGSESIKRGTIVALKSATDGSPVFAIANTNPYTDAILYVSLQDYTDPTAGFAGTSFDPKGGTPCITALSLDMEGEYETSVFKNEDYSIGDALYVENGLLTKTQPSGGVVVGHVTGVKTERWINNAIAVPENGTDQRLAIRTGANMKVIRFKTK